METCIFCEILEGKKPSFFIYRDEATSAFLDISPVAEGHILVIPNRHFQHLSEATDDEMKNLLFTTSRILSALRKSSIPCRGANILINDGKAANQHVPHLHIHIIPRKGGDLKTLIFNLFFRNTPFIKREKLKKRFQALVEEIQSQLD